MSNTLSFVSAIIGTEVLSLIIYLVLLIGSIMESREKSERTRWFILLVCISSAGCFCDLLSWLMDGHPEWNAVLYFTTLGSMIMTIVIVGAFISYLSAYVSERKRMSKLPVQIGWAVVVVGVITTIITGITGNLFVFQNGYFSEKPFYSGYVIANTAYLIIGIVVVIQYRNVLNRYDKLAAYAYILFPAISAILGLLIDDWDFSYPAITISLLILYIMIQADQTKRLETEGIIANYQAQHDELTRLYNRSAYQNHIRYMRLQDENCGVIFSDLNGLKYTNDTYGHKAGDQLLIRYTKILSDLFRMNEMYRTGGDEFICIMEDVSEDVFRKRADDLQSILNQETPPLACIGASYGSTRDIESIIRDAEVKMYAEKQVIHESFPQMRRGTH